MKRTIEDKIKKILINFAKKNKKVLAIYPGHDPERRNSVVYYFVKDSLSYERRFSNKIVNLELRILKKCNANVALIHWPIRVEDAEHYGFLKRCIYQKS